MAMGFSNEFRVRRSNEFKLYQSASMASNRESSGRGVIFRKTFGRKLDCI
jgi:hypothetical protein